MVQIIQKRRDTAAQWTAVNPVLADGEEGYERDTRKSKVGDGVTPWNSLPYIAGGTGGSSTAIVNNLDSSNAAAALGADQGPTIKAGLQAATTHAASTANPHAVTKAQLGLGNVENYSAATLPLSDAAVAALATKKNDLAPVTLPDANTTLTAAAHANRTLLFPATATANRTYTVPNDATTGDTGTQFAITTPDGIAFAPTITNGTLSLTGSATAIVGIEKKTTTSSMLLKASASGGVTLVNNLTTNDPAQALGADQGVVLKALCDTKSPIYGTATIAVTANLIGATHANKDCYYDSLTDGVLTASTDSVTGCTGNESFVIYTKPTGGKPTISNGTVSVQGDVDRIIGATRIAANNYMVWSINRRSGVVFGASGAGHAVGLVPDPGVTAGTTKFLREDGTWAVPAGAATTVSLSGSPHVENAAPSSLVLDISAALSSTYVPATSDFPFTNSGGSQTVTAVAVSGTTVTLTLSRATVGGEILTVAYPRPASGALQTAAGDLVTAFGVKAVTNNVSTLPTVSSATIANASPTKITVVCSQTITSTAPSGAGGFALTVSGAAMTVSSVAIVGGNVELTCSRSFAAGETVSLAYTQPGTNNIASATGALANFSGQSVINNVASSLLRFTPSGTAAPVESQPGGAGTPYTYTCSSGAGLTTSHLSSPNLSFGASNASQVSWQGVMNFAAGAGAFILGLDSTSGDQTYTSMDYAVYSGNGTGAAYQVVVSGSLNSQNGGNALTSAEGDVVRLRRAGGGNQIIAEVARSGTPTTFVLLHTFAATSTAQLFPLAGIQGSTSVKLSAINHSNLT